MCTPLKSFRRKLYAAEKVTLFLFPTQKQPSHFLCVYIYTYTLYKHAVTLIIPLIFPAIFSFVNLIYCFEITHDCIIWVRARKPRLISKTFRIYIAAASRTIRCPTLTDPEPLKTPYTHTYSRIEPAPKLEPVDKLNKDLGGDHLISRGEPPCPEKSSAARRLSISA